VITSLTLTKFKRHESLHIDFTGGLVVLRGSNEVGKSTVFHAIAYALYGSRGLPDSLDDTVTYGFPASQLKVELKFSHCGVDYELVRSKSGATLTGGGNISSGQAEVTAYVSSLFGLRQEVATKITIANQSSLKAAVEGGVQALTLIESLSGMGLIDDLIGLVQEKLPSGNTSSLAAQVQQLKSLEAPVADFDALEDAVNGARLELGAKQSAVNVLQDEIDGIDAPTLRQRVREADAAESREAELMKTVKGCTEALLTPVPNKPADRRDEYNARALEEAEHKKLRELFKQFSAIQQVDPAFYSYAEYKQEVDRVKNALIKSTAIVQQIEVELAVAKAARINDTSCALCGKLLSEVPEVVTTNARVDANVLRLESLLEAEKDVGVGLRKEKATLDYLLEQDTKFSAAFTKFGSHISQLGTVPATAIWLTKIAEAAPISIDWKQLKADNEAELHKWYALQAEHEAAKKRLADAKVALESLIKVDATSAREALARLDGLQRSMFAAKDTVATYMNKLHIAESALNRAKADYSAKLSAYKQVRHQLEQAELTLAECEANNQIITKLRNARPVVAKQLWNTVLHAVSTYFSQIRGTHSVVTKSDKGFLVDGKSYTNLSGSTVDSLGLAVRMALQKTFLPSLDFMLLDEPASGMDDEREAAMLGTLASCGYEQVVLVTHSELADSFAAQVVRL
jgi:DNA repair exonuclease SbcCD ATPase subunit